MADKLSRQGPISTEWTLDQAGRQVTAALEPPPQIDLFATHEKVVLENFVSSVVHPKATAVDVFSLDWTIWDMIYLFPPKNLILRVLVHLRTFKGTANLVTPYWPNRPWFRELKRRNLQVVKLQSGLIQRTSEGEVPGPPGCGIA